MRLTRRQFVGGAAAATALGAAGIYKLVDELAEAPERVDTAMRFSEQHLLDGVRVVRDNDVEVLVPPLHHQVVTAKVRVGESPAELREARQELEATLRRLDQRFETTPTGLGVTVAWGLPYFERYVPGQAERHLPVDLRATAARGEQVRVLENAIRFPTDPGSTRLESNDLAVLLRSDSLEHVTQGSQALFDDLDDLFRVTSIRKGFVGGGFEGEPGLPKQMAQAARIEGADLIPDGSQLFLGFTSTQKAGLGPSRIANIETLGYADLGRSDYFAQGTHMHLSHLFEDVAAWYLIFDFQKRVDTTFRPGLEVSPQTQTVAQGPDEAQTEEEVRQDYEQHRRIGHSGSMQPATRLAEDVVGPDGTRYEKGTAFPNAPTSTPSTTRSSGPPTQAPTHSTSSRPPASISSPSTRRATTSGACGSRWTGPPGRPPLLRGGGRRPRLQHDPRDDAPPELPRATARAPLVSALRAPNLSEQPNETCQRASRRPASPGGIASRAPSQGTKGAARGGTMGSPAAGLTPGTPRRDTCGHVGRGTGVR